MSNIEDLNRRRQQKAVSQHQEQRRAEDTAKHGKMDGISVGRQGDKVVIVLPRPATEIAFGTREAIAFAQALTNSAGLILEGHKVDPIQPQTVPANDDADGNE